MLFASPWYLLGALGAAIPVLLHLYGRRRARRVPFPSLMLLKAAQRERTSLVRLRQVWLMLLRALAILLLSLGLSRPTVPWVRVAADPEGLAVVALDDSLSMRTKVGQSRFEVAKRAAGEILKALPERQLTALLLASRSETAEFDTPPALARGLADRQPSWQAVDLPQVLAELRGRFQGRRHIYLLTDLQASNWLSASASGERRALTAEDAVTVIDCGQEIANRALESLSVTEPPALVGRPVELAAQVRQYGKPSPGEVRVRLDRGELPSQTVTATEHSQALLDWQPEKAGPVAATALLTPDALREDDAADTVIDVRDQLRVALLGTAEQTRWVRLALSPDPAAHVQVTNGAPTSQTDVAEVWSLSGADALKTCAEAGGGVLLFVLDLPAEGVDKLLGEGVLKLGALKTATTGLHLGAFDVFNAPLQAFANPAAGDLQEPSLRRYREVTLPTGSPLQTAASYEDGTPALLRGPWGHGRVLIANFGTGPDDGDLARQPVFVPLMHRLAGYLARRDWPELDEVAAGEEVVLTPAEGSASPSCAGPEGRQTAVTATATGWRLRPEQPGIYQLRWTMQGTARSRPFAVNTDPLESDPRRLSLDELRKRLSPATVTVVKPPEAAQSVQRAPLSIGTTLLVFAFLLLLAETALTLAGRARGGDEQASQP